MPRKVDGQVMREANRALVLNLVRMDTTLSRAKIVRYTGLSPAAVSGIVDQLLREGLIHEERTEATGHVGRRPLRLTLNAGARLSLGVYIDVCSVSAALVDLSGVPGAVVSTPLPPGSSPEQALDLAADLANRLLHDLPEERLIGIGAAVPGMVSWPEGINLFSPNLGWHNVPVRTLLEARLRRPVLVDNEVRALALAEYQYGAARGARSVIFLDAGYGVGGAVILDGALYRGRRGAAGEFGHNTVDPEGPYCGCGNRGCLEVFASTSGLAARAREAIAAGKSTTLTPDTLALCSLIAAAHRGDTVAAELLRRAATYLGLAVANAIDNWDPELVVLSGEVIYDAGLFDAILAAEQRSVLETGRAGVRIVRAQLEQHVKIVGAATLVITEYLAASLLGGASFSEDQVPPVRMVSLARGAPPARPSPG
jgi:N-acetylglucosamine repressor